MRIIDVFNGDADGICALTQLRHANPIPDGARVEIITGVKRDINLLQQVSAQKGDRITVLDVSMDKNKEALLDALGAGAEVFYCDHHVAGEIPDAPNLTALINTSADVCTSLLVNGHLNGAFAAWAVTGAFGDNLIDSAKTLARTLNLDEQQLQQLQNLGIFINYNGYGAALDDLHFTPLDLYREVVKYASPLEFIAGNPEVFDKLKHGYHDDMTLVQAMAPEVQFDHATVFVLPDEKWARRVSGVFSNDLANNHSHRAHAVLTEKSNGNYLVSIRAPLSNKQGAADICSQFETGGGRAAAAGVNDLPAAEMQRFIDVFESYYRSGQ